MNGSQRHFKLVVGALMGDLYRYAYFLCRDRSLSQDLVQETLLRAWRSVDKLRDPGAVKSWLITTLRREKEDLVGADRIGSVPYKGQHPHGAVLETLYSEIKVKGHTGEVIVKRNYGGKDITNSKVANDRAGYLKAVTVMFKRESGYDPDNNDWFWVKYLPDGSLDTNPKGMKLAGRVAKGMPEGCIACHSGMKANDYQFNTTSFIDD